MLMIPRMITLQALLTNVLLQQTVVRPSPPEISAALQPSIIITADASANP
jgi:hypothetical protein